MRIGRRPSRCGSARKIGCQLLPESYFSARSGPVSGTVSPRIRRDSKLDSAGIHGRARLTYDLSLWETAWVEFSRFVFLIFIGSDRHVSSAPRLVTASSRVCARRSRMRRGIQLQSSPRYSRIFQLSPMLLLLNFYYGFWEQFFQIFQNRLSVSPISSYLNHSIE